MTGGASGVGRVIAESFIEDGAAVHVCDASADHIEVFLSNNPTATATLCDVADADQVEHVFDALNKTRGDLHVLINNAGVAGWNWDHSISVSSTGRQPSRGRFWSGFRQVR